MRPRSKDLPVYRRFQGGASFVDPSCSYVSHLALWYVMFPCVLVIGVSGQVWYLIV